MTTPKAACAFTEGTHALQREMSEAKRKRMQPEVRRWYHGTDEYFEQWEVPARSKYKPELPPHSFISFTKDVSLARDAGRVAGGLCSVTVRPGARIMDLRCDTADNRKHWNLVTSTELGSKHLHAKRYSNWLHACKTGTILRMVSDDPVLGVWYAERNHIHKQSGVYSPRDRQAAYLEIQLFQRRWIEEVISPAKSLGYDAVICCEIDRFRLKGAVACVNLHVFNSEAVSSPCWDERPDESKMTPYMDVLRRLGLG